MEEQATFSTVAQLAPEDDWCMYRRLVIVRRVMAGDFLEVDMDLGFGVWMHRVKLWLARIVIPEAEPGDYAKATLAVQELMAPSIENERPVRVQVNKLPGKYNRTVAEVFACPTPSALLPIDLSQIEWVNVSDWLIARGLAAGL